LLPYSARRKPGGGIDEARKILIEAEAKFPKEPIIPYNLACYDCQRGDFKAAWRWLEKAFGIGDPKAFKLMALEDADLEPLWAEIGEI